jgi:rhodanese-related sulfurtransferase
VRDDSPTVTKLIDYDQFCGFGGQEKVANTINQMPVEELKRRLDAGDDLVVLDVREPHEFMIANLTGTKPDVKFIPLGDLGKRIGELEEFRDREIVVHCKMGGRSQKAAEQLQAAGFTKLHNLAGGITAWSEKVDPKVAKYVFLIKTGRYVCAMSHTVLSAMVA